MKLRINSETRIGGRLEIKPDAVSPFKIAMLKSVTTELTEARTGDKYTLTFEFSDAKNHTLIQKYWAIDYADANPKMKVESLLSSVGHILSMFTDNVDIAEPEGIEVVDDATHSEYYKLFFENVVAAFNAVTYKDVHLWLLPVYDLRGNVALPMFPAFVQKYVKGTACELQVDKRYHNLIQPEVKPKGSQNPAANNDNGIPDIPM